MPRGLFEKYQNLPMVPKRQESNVSFETMTILTKGIAAISGSGRIEYPLWSGEVITPFSCPSSGTLASTFFHLRVDRVLLMEWVFTPEKGDQCFLCILCHRRKISCIADMEMKTSVNNFAIIRATYRTPQYSQYLVIFSNHKDILMKVVLIHHYRTLCEVSSLTPKAFLKDIFGLTRYTRVFSSRNNGRDRNIRLLIGDINGSADNDVLKWGVEVQFKIRVG